MKTYWMTAVLLSSTLAIGCGGSGENTADSAAETAAVPCSRAGTGSSS